jgi:magnesium-transporting ATPase (P-type)
MKVLLFTMMGLFLLAGVAEASQAANIEKESGTVFTSILNIVVKWIFPICAAYCFLHGVIGKGVKRGEWDMAVVCVIAAVALALFPKLLTSLFKVTL